MHNTVLKTSVSKLFYNYNNNLTIHQLIIDIYLEDASWMSMVCTQILTIIFYLKILIFYTQVEKITSCHPLDYCSATSFFESIKNSPRDFV